MISFLVEWGTTSTLIGFTMLIIAGIFSLVDEFTSFKVTSYLPDELIRMWLSVMLACMMCGILFILFSALIALHS